jgi:hypothetical protein
MYRPASKPRYCQSILAPPCLPLTLLLPSFAPCTPATPHNAHSRHRCSRCGSGRRADWRRLRGCCQRHVCTPGGV